MVRLSQKTAPLEVETEKSDTNNKVKKIEVIDDQHETIEGQLDNITILPCKKIIDTEFIDTLYSRFAWTWGDADTYRAISDLIENIHNNHKRTILFASQSIKYLPVTALVNVAMKTARKGLRCLLVDFDFTHHSLSKTFGAVGAGKPVDTCIKNLKIWSPRETQTNYIQEFKNSINQFKEQFDTILIYAPAITGRATQQQIATCIDTAMLFDGGKTTEKTSLSKLYEILKSNDVELILPQNQTAALDTMFC